MTEYHRAVLVPERHVDAVEAFLSGLEEMERYATDHV